LTYLIRLKRRYSPYRRLIECDMWYYIRGVFLNKIICWFNKKYLEYLKLPGWWGIFDSKGQMLHLSDSLKRIIDPHQRENFKIWEDVLSPFTEEFQKKLQKIFQEVSEGEFKLSDVQTIDFKNARHLVTLRPLRNWDYWVLWIISCSNTQSSHQANFPLIPKQPGILQPLHTLQINASGTLSQYLKLSCSTLKNTEMDQAPDKSVTRYLGVFKQTMRTLAQGIVFFNPSQRMVFANQSFQKLFALGSDWVGKGSSFDDFFDQLRYQRMMPEVLDFSAYKKRFLNFFETPCCVEELLHLPDERSVKLTVVSERFSGLVLIFEDITQQFIFQRQYNNLLKTQQTVVENLQEGIVIFGIDRRITMLNKAFKLFFHPDRLKTKPNDRLEICLEKQQPFFAKKNGFNHCLLGF